jgi:hypothetical protein
MGIFKLKLFLFCPLLLVRQRSFTFAAYQQRLLLVEAGHTNEGADLLAHEYGHVLGAAANPRAYANAVSNQPNNYDCQEPGNRYNIVTKQAMDMQQRFLKLLNKH